MKKSENIAVASGCVGMGVGMALFIGLGVTQWLAIYAWVDMNFDLPWIVSGGLTMMVGFIPIIGNVCGTIGAITAWGWPWWLAAILFFGTWILYFGISVLGTLISPLGQNK